MTRYLAAIADGVSRGLGLSPELAAAVRRVVVAVALAAVAYGCNQAADFVAGVRVPEPFASFGGGALLQGASKWFRATAVSVDSGADG